MREEEDRGEVREGKEVRSRREEERGSRSRGDMEEEQASLQAAQGGSEQKCGNAKCIMCTTLDRFTCLCFPLCLACIEMKILESWEKI